MARILGPHTYVPLTRYLAALRVEAVTLTLAEIEQILGTPSPVSAQQAYFWSNYRRGLYGVRPWTAAGWRMRRTVLWGRSPAVTFMRDPADAGAGHTTAR